MLSDGPAKLFLGDGNAAGGHIFIQGISSSADVRRFPVVNSAAG